MDRGGSAQRRVPSGGVIGGGRERAAATATHRGTSSGSAAAAKRSKKKAKKRRKLAEPVVEVVDAHRHDYQQDPDAKEGGSEDGQSADGSKPWHGCPADVLAWMISPIKLDVFFGEYWEKKPLVIRRKRRKYYGDLFNADVLDALIRKNPVKFGVNLDVTQYVDGERRTLNPEGRAHANVVWALYEEGCSVRLLNPQTYNDNVWALCATLQEYFGCMVGCNTYLTPAGTQGFAPHYDDIEAFILQVEGRKRWRLYNNPSGETLPRFSSGNFEQEEIGEVILDITLEPGDLLYFPRGVVHQGVAPEEGAEHSHHLTISAYQQNDWMSYLSKLVPRSLELAAEQDAEFRQGLPLNFLSFMGLVHEGTADDSKRQRFIRRAKTLMTKLIEHAPFDAAADQLGVNFVHESLPPYLSRDEISKTDKATPATGRTLPLIAGDSEVKLLRPHIARLVLEEDRAVVYYATDNARVFRGEEAQSSEYPIEMAEGIEYILLAHDYKRVDSIPCGDKEAQIDLATSLFDLGILLLLQDEPDPDFS